MMQFKFDANQEFQIQAIEAIAGLFEGQPRHGPELAPAIGAAFAAVPNRLDLEEAALLGNLGAVQQRNGLPLDRELAFIEALIETVEGPRTTRFPNFSVEMETGTGKTYVYLRTALELFRRFGFRKFIIVVPSIAIREGVLKTLQVTKPHLQALYGNLPYRFYVYDSENLSQVRQFALADSVELMVMTIDSFNKASNVIRQSTDRLQGETPIHLVQATRPVLVLDEPQNMESELRVQALSALDPLFAIRYSATHRNPYNLVYRLTPFEAYRQGLVKRIEVASVVQEGELERPFLRVDAISSQKKTVTARITLHKLMKTGTIKEKSITVRPADSLAAKSGRPEYAGYEVDEINPGGGFVRFANDTELPLGQSQGADREAIFDAQIRYTIEEHFHKQAKLRSAGIKVLSLFFIDHVDNYARDDGMIRRQFVQAFDELKVHHAEWRASDSGRVRAAYFAEKRRKGGEVEALDSFSGKTKEDEAAFDLIMKDKERLLSLDEPVAFIFSHSALREGWDNPNIFQICTLNQTASEMKKRQEVGRGVRLAVDQTGNRVWDEHVNVLTVVANESYERFVGQLQTEIEEEYGLEGVPPKPSNARRRSVARLRKEFTLRPEFKELWERIKQRTRYAVKVDSERLLTDVKRELDQVVILPPRVMVTKAAVEVGERDILSAKQMAAERAERYLVGVGRLPNLIGVMASLMEQTTPPVRLTRTTLLGVYRQTANIRAAFDNPQDFALAAVRILKEKVADQLVEGIFYQKIDDWYEMTQLEAEIESWEEHLVPAERSVYDHVLWESEVERKFVEDLERRRDVKLYLKLPRWFTVPTPVGDYNPDWAIVIEPTDTHGKATGEPALYLVRETKGENWRTDLRLQERRKIYCGEKHFSSALGVDYKVVTSARDLP